MNKIIAKKNISENLVKFEIRTVIALNDIKTGQYVLLTVEKNELGIPVAVVKTDPEKEIVTVMVYANDHYNRQLAELNSGSELFAIDGPYGYPVPIENFGTVLCIGRGPGIVLLLPVLTSLHVAGNRIITILSAQTKEGIILENEINAVSDELIKITNDGSCGEKGSICQTITQIMKPNKINEVVAFGSATTIKVVRAHTTKYNIPAHTVLCLNKTGQNTGHGIFKVSICGTGMEICVDGFNFNAWYPNFDEMIKRFGHEEEIPYKTIGTDKVNISV